LGHALVPLFSALGYVPASLAATAGKATGQVTGLLPTGSKEQLIKNHQRLSDFPLGNDHVRRSFSTYFEMFTQTPSLHRWSEEKIRSSVEVENREQILEALDQGPVIVAMTHSGNWDLAGAWANYELAKVVTVAEVLDPPELYDYFVETREALGMEILPAKRGIFQTLRDQVKDRSVLVPLLADRDITGSGIEVDFGGHRALVAAGPAALARDLGAPLWVNHMSSRRTTSKSGKATAKYTVHLRPVETTGDVEVDTQAWVDVVVPLIQSSLADWHMLQPLFVDDLDQERLARARQRHAKEAEETGEQ
jgi:lauroyl/myristoyl acyltransferase